MEQAGTWAAAWLDTIQAGHPMPACLPSKHAVVSLPHPSLCSEKLLDLTPVG